MESKRCASCYLLSHSLVRIGDCSINYMDDAVPVCQDFHSEMELVRGSSSSFEVNSIIKLSKKLEWHSYFEPSAIIDDDVSRYIYELQCFVLECSAVAERHKVVRREQTAKVHVLEAYLEGKINMVEFNQFEVINFEPLTFAFPPAPSKRPQDSILVNERDEVIAYVGIMEDQAYKCMRQMEDLAKDLKFITDMVEGLNEEIFNQSIEMVKSKSPQKKRKRNRRSGYFMIAQSINKFNLLTNYLGGGLCVESFLSFAFYRLRNGKRKYEL